MIVLGFSVGHDKGAVLIKDGKVVVGITQERLSRIKHDGGYSNGEIPVSSIMYCMSELDITIEDIDLIVYSSTELEDKTYELFNKVFRVPKKKLQFIPHHLAHAYSSFFSSGYEEGAVIVADASGSILNHKTKLKDWYPEKDLEVLSKKEDWAEGISIYHFTRDNYKEVYKKWIKYPVPIDTDEDVSVGTVYSMGSLQLVYDPNSHSWNAGKLMGMASYADPEIVNEAPKFITYEDGKLFIPNNRIYPRVGWNSDFHSRACVAGIYQREQERVSLFLADIAKTKTDSKRVCTTGGSFLNCSSNEKILNSGLFEECFFLPPADDSGIPLGCAWYAYQQVANIGPTTPIVPYFGKSYGSFEIETAAQEFEGIQIESFKDFGDIVTFITGQLIQNRVVGWFQGGSEIGPRALGNRSILTSPKHSWMKDYINHEIKKREWYRPFAPAVIFDRQPEIFEEKSFSPFMLVTSKVKDEWKEKIPACVHIDGTARYQSVTPVSNPRFYQLLSKFEEVTEIPVLLNTSFNGPHEPIVVTPYDAIRTFISQNLDFLVIGDYIISRLDR
jgi:carbamoyltransferase